MRTGQVSGIPLSLVVLTGCALALMTACSSGTAGSAGTPVAAPPTSTVPGPSPTTPVGAPSASPTTVPTTSAPPPTGPPPTVLPHPTTSTEPTPSATPTPTPAPKVLLRAGQSGSQVRELQARLRQIRWYSGDVTDHYGTRTTAAVKGFQAKRGYPATGMLDERTWDRLLSMSRPPTSDELHNIVPKPAPPTQAAGLTWDVDQRCLTGRVMCISKSTRMLTWVIDGKPQYQFAVRFGSEALPTREGTFHVFSKQKDVISNLYFTPMPYSLFFSGGQAVHYSSNFARLGYNGSSHGCVNVRDWDGIVRLFNDSRIGDKVVVHW